MAVVLTDIVDEIARATRLTRPESRVVADRILDAIAEGLSRGEDLEIRNFGTFKTRVVSGKVGRHLSTGATVILPPMRKVSFKAGKTLQPVRMTDPPRRPVPSWNRQVRGANVSCASNTNENTKDEGATKLHDNDGGGQVPSVREPVKEAQKRKNGPVDGEQIDLWGV